MTTAWEKFRSLVSEHALIVPGDRVVAAVSGGPDSIAMLHLLWRLKKTVPFHLVALTMDHGLRRAARAETRLVASLCATLKIPCEIQTIDVKTTAAATKQSIETAARDLRYATLCSYARAHQCRTIATAHTASDNAETMLMWLVRGTGSAGLGGIPLKRQEHGRPPITVIRPVLPLTRDEIEAYIAAQKLPSCIDRSNFSLEYTRNRIRLRVIPQLKDLNPRFEEHAYTLSRIIGGENALLDALADAAYQASVSTKKDSTRCLDLRRYIRYNTLVQHRLLRQLVPVRRTAHTIAALDRFIADKQQRSYTIARGCVAVKRGPMIEFQICTKK